MCNNKDFLPYFNSLNEDDKQFWLECSKEILIDHFIASIKNGEVLLNRIDKAIEYIENECYFCYKDNEKIFDRTPTLELLKILRGDIK